MAIRQVMAQVEQVHDAFRAAVHDRRDVDGALHLVTAGCVLTNLPMATGGQGTDSLRRYLTEDVVPHLPGDLELRRVSRTVDTRRLVDEVVVTFTHDGDLPWLLPKMAPTGRTVSVLAVSVVTFEHTSRLGAVTSRIASHRTLWDAAALAAVGVNPARDCADGR